MSINNLLFSHLDMLSSSMAKGGLKGLFREEK